MKDDIPSAIRVGFELTRFLGFDGTPDIAGETILQISDNPKPSPYRHTFAEKLHACKWKLMPRMKKKLSISITFEEYPNDLAACQHMLRWLHQLTKEKQ